MKIFTIGASGMVGSKIVELLQDKYTFDDLSLTSGVDITDASSLEGIKNDTEHEVVIHLAAKADVDGCEKDKELGEAGAAFRINVLGTRNVIEACRKTDKKIIYISTDFVFDGVKEAPYQYTEDDVPNPLNWYAMTKYQGEEIVRQSGIPSIIMRIAYPYRDEFTLKDDFVRAIAKRLQNNLPIAGITDHIMTPTLIDDFAPAIDALITNQAIGIYHVVGNQSLSPYEAACMIAKKIGIDPNVIKKTTRTEYFNGKAPRPFNLALNNDKITQLKVHMTSFEEGLEKVMS
jgi:dTDP-4-dehydrorhamnose reductase